MTYTDVMNQALDFRINSNLKSNQDNNSENDSVPPPSYKKCDKDETSAKLFLCTNSHDKEPLVFSKSYSKKIINEKIIYYFYLYVY